MRNGWTLVAVCAVLIAFGAASENKEPVLGAWLTTGGDSHVEIVMGTDGKLSGKITWLAEPNYPADDAEAGKAKHDRLNPDASKQAAPIIGLEVLKGFTKGSDGVWSGGTVYDPKNGKTYKCKITLSEDGKKLNVRGYIGVSLIGRTEVWDRYQAPAAPAK